MAQQFDPRLKLRILASDAAVLTVVWVVVMWFGPHSMQRSKPRSLLLAALLTVVACVAIRQVGLLLSRRCAVRATELRLIGKVTAFTVVFGLLFDRVFLSRTGLRFYVTEAAVGAVLMAVGLAMERAVWRSILRASRQAGLRGRRVVLLGTNSDARRLVDLFIAHPEHGLRVVGVVGSRDDAERNALGHLWLGTAREVIEVVDERQASGVVVAAGPIEHPFVDDAIRTLLSKGVHVQLSTGLAGMDISRFRHLPIAREPMLYVEQRALGRPAQFAKRAFDLAGALFFIAILSPALAVIALLVKLDDRGPVFYRQVRGGREGRLFKVIKFRTMVVDADKKLAELAHLNTREGALFKVDNDPRVTRVGRFLRLSSLDELPQLFNVVAGHMSLVGPRPALPDEIEQFDEQLRARDSVRPGITGLWQVEARDSPSAAAYRRLDLFYLENRSFMGDLAILLDTIEHLLGRVYHAAYCRPDGTAATEAATEEPAGPKALPAGPISEPGIAKSA